MTPSTPYVNEQRQSVHDSEADGAAWGPREQEFQGSIWGEFTHPDLRQAGPNSSMP